MTSSSIPAGTVTGFNRHTSKRYATDISRSVFPGSIPFCYESGAGVGYNVHEGIWTYPEESRLETGRASGSNSSGHGDIPENAPTERYISWPSYVHGNIRSREPLYDRYTTRHWSKYLINRLPDPENKGEFFYMSEGFTLYSVRNWTSSSRILHGKLFDRNIQELARPVGIPHELGATHGTGMEQTTKAEIHISFLGESP